MARMWGWGSRCLNAERSFRGKEMANRLGFECTSLGSPLTTSQSEASRSALPILGLCSSYWRLRGSLCRLSGHLNRIELEFTYQQYDDILIRDIDISCMWDFNYLPLVIYPTLRHTWTVAQTGGCHDQAGTAQGRGF